MVRPIQSFFGNCDIRKKMIRDIVNTRNYLTHYDDSLKSKAAHGIELYMICRKMEMIIRLHFLKLLEFKEEEIKTLIDNFNRMSG